MLKQYGISLIGNNISGQRQHQWPKTTSVAKDNISGQRQHHWPKTTSLAKDNISGQRQHQWPKTTSVAKDNISGQRQHHWLISHTASSHNHALSEDWEKIIRRELPELQQRCFFPGCCQENMVTRHRCRLWSCAMILRSPMLGN